MMKEKECEKREEDIVYFRNEFNKIHKNLKST